jgi:methyl-accepting chemotaxis protein
MEENKDTQPQSDKKELNVDQSPDGKYYSLAKSVGSLSAELEGVKKTLQKRKRENTTLKVLFYTGLLVLLVGFLYSNSVLQRAHMRSLEKNIISLEHRLSHEINQVKLSLELDIQGAKKEVELIDDADIFTVLERMDYAISQLRPKKEQITALVNQVRLNTDEFTQLLRNQTKSYKSK